MKKTVIFSLILLSIVMFNLSCSSDDNNNNNEQPPVDEQVFMVNIEGASVVYTNISTSTFEDVGTTIRNITGTIDSNNLMEMEMYEGQTGSSNAIRYLKCIYNGNEYIFSPPNNIIDGVLNYSVTENSSDKVKGVFSGTIDHTMSGNNPLNISNGEFSINK